MRNLKSSQKEFLKRFQMLNNGKQLKKHLKKVNSEIAGLTDDQFIALTIQFTPIRLERN